MIQRGDIRIQFMNMIVVLLIWADLIILLVLFLLFGPFGFLGMIANFETISPLPEIAIILLIPLITLKLFLHSDDRYALLFENRRVLIKSHLPFLSRELKTDEIIKIKSVQQTDKFSISTQNEIFEVSIPKEHLEILKISTLNP